MIVSRRFFAWEDVDLRRWLFRHPSFLVEDRGRSRRLERGPPVEGARLWALVHDWPSVTIPMRGRGVIRSATAAMEMGGGQIGFVRARQRVPRPNRAGSWLRRVRAVGPGGLRRAERLPLVSQRLAARDQARIEAVLLRLTADAHAPMEAEGAVAELFQILGALGVLTARPEAGNLVTTSPPRTVLTGLAIDRVLAHRGLPDGGGPHDGARLLGATRPRPGARVRRRVRAAGGDHVAVAREPLAHVPRRAAHDGAERDDRAGGDGARLRLAHRVLPLARQRGAAVAGRDAPHRGGFWPITPSISRPHAPGYVHRCAAENDTTDICAAEAM